MQPFEGLGEASSAQKKDASISFPVMLRSQPTTAKQKPSTKLRSWFHFCSSNLFKMSQTFQVHQFTYLVLD